MTANCKLSSLPVDDPKRIEGERQRRRYVKRSGGIVKGLSPEDIEKAAKLCSDYGRTSEGGWDTEIVIGDDVSQYPWPNRAPTHP